MGLLSVVSHITSLELNNEPKNQTLASQSGDTAVAMQPDDTSLDCTTSTRDLCGLNPAGGTYEVESKITTMVITRPSTGEKQTIEVNTYSPKGYPGKSPGIVFMHGAGYGTARDVYKDVVAKLVSAGFVATTLDKPVWSTNNLNRDYPGSAHAYDQVIDYVRSLPNVDASKVGIYSTSESTWISTYLIKEDPDIAFHIMLSPMLFSPRMTLGFFVAQDFSIIGAHPGYQGIVRRVFSADLEAFGLHNADIDPITPQTLSIPTFLAYGSKDVMTSQVSGANKLMDLAHDAGNTEFVIRSYPLGNHVLNIGSDHEGSLADHYLDDLADWTTGVVKGYHQTNARVGGADIYQSIGIPYDIQASKSLTFYGGIVHVLALLSLAVTVIFSLVVLVMRIVARVRHQPSPLGIIKGFSRSLRTISITTIASLLLYAAGIAQIVLRVIDLVWGSAPIPAGMIYWSWYVVQISTAAVVWAWSSIFAVLLKEGYRRGWFNWMPLIAHEPHANRKELAKMGPVLASRKLGVAYFTCVTVSMLLVLLVLAFWGLFIY